MHFSIASRQLPEAEGTASGKALLATVEGLRAAGHTVDVWSWGPCPPAGDLPAGCRWAPLPPAPMLRTKARALVRPRSDPAIARWRPAPGALAVADDPFSFAAVAPHPRSVLVQHYLTSLDLRALGRLQPRDVQDLRAERRNARRACAIIAYSQRVATALARRAVAVPIPYRAPEASLAPVEEPVALLLADWRWPPNQRALRWLAELWPETLARVPQARLLLAGRGLPSAPSRLDRCHFLGEVPASADALAQAGVIAFPCPPTSGPKVKVLEALAHGIPVLTTPAGAEGISGGDGLVVSSLAGFAGRLARLLADHAARVEAGRRGREAVLAVHAPLPAARARVAALERLLPRTG